MKELYLAEINKTKDKKEMEVFINTISRMIPDTDSKNVCLSYIKNMINSFSGNYINPVSVQINIYNRIDMIISHVNEWLKSFDSNMILAELPSMIDNYRSGDFNQMVLDAIKQKEAPKPDNPEPSNPSSSQANSTAGVENNVVPEIIIKCEEELKEKFGKYGISDVDSLINTLKGKDEKIMDDFVVSFKQSINNVVDALIKDKCINIDKEFVKNICNEINIDCTDKEIDDFVKEVKNIIGDGTIELKSSLKNSIDKMVDAVIRLIREATESNDQQSKEEIVDVEVIEPNTSQSKEDVQEESKQEPKEKEQVEKNAKEEIKEESPEKEDAIIPVPINKDTVRILSNILNLDNKGFKDIFDTLGDTQQEFIKVIIAFKNGKTKGKKPFKMLMSDYNELVTLNNNLTNKKEQAVQQSNEVKTTATATA